MAVLGHTRHSHYRLMCLEPSLIDTSYVCVCWTQFIPLSLCFLIHTAKLVELTGKADRVKPRRTFHQPWANPCLAPPGLPCSRSTLSLRLMAEGYPASSSLSDPDFNQHGG